VNYFDSSDFDIVVIIAYFINITMIVGFVVIGLFHKDSAVDIVRLYWTFNIYQFYNLELPRVLGIFLRDLSRPLFIFFIDNPFDAADNSNCEKMHNKFIEDDLSCMYLGNNGLVFLFLIILFFLKFVLETWRYFIIRSHNKTRVKNALEDQKFDKEWQKRFDDLDQEETKAINGGLTDVR
jgi:hypothetical protein